VSGGLTVTVSGISVKIEVDVGGFSRIIVGVFVGETVTLGVNVPVRVGVVDGGTEVFVAVDVEVVNSGEFVEVVVAEGGSRVKVAVDVADDGTGVEVADGGIGLPVAVGGRGLLVEVGVVEGGIAV